MTLHRQRRNIEILKIRFGEAALQVCEVMLRDMTDSKRIDQHVQSQHAVRLSRYFDLLYVEMMLGQIVNYAPDNHIATFLADAGVKRYCDAWPVREVRLSLAQHPNMASLARLLIVYIDFRRNTRRNSRPSNQTKSFAGSLILAQFTWSSSSRIERLWLMWHHWKLLSLSCSRRKVSPSSLCPDYSSFTC